MAYYTFALEDVKRAFSSHSFLLGDDGCMKANRKFIEKEAGVSAVIGVILMVAITVAIAATVYVYVSGMMGEPATNVPVITFQIDQSDDQIKLITSDLDISWDSLSIKSSEDVVIWINDDATITVDGYDLAANTVTPFAVGMIEGGAIVDLAAGDYIDIEGGTRAIPGPKTDVVITITHHDTNTMIGEYTFPSIAAVAD